MKKLSLVVFFWSVLGLASSVTVAPVGGGGGGSGNVVSINSDTTAAVTLSVGTSGTDFAIADDAAGGHVFNLPDASGSARGIVKASGAQTLGIDLTLSGASPIISALTASKPVCTTGSKAFTSTCTGFIPWSAIATGNNYRLIATGAAGVPAEAAAITASKGLCSDANGIPVACTSGPSTTEMGYVTGLTSSAQTQITAKAPSDSPAFTTQTTFSYGTATTVPYWDGSKHLVASATTPTELGYLAGLTSSLTVDEIDGFLEAPTDKIYTLMEKVKAAMVVTTVTYKTVSGTATAALKINGTNITSCSAVAVSSTQGTTTCTAANALAAGDRLTMVLSSGSSPVDLAFTVGYTR